MVQVGSGQEVPTDHFQTVASGSVASDIRAAVSIALSMTNLLLEFFFGHLAGCVQPGCSPVPVALLAKRLSLGWMSHPDG
jgi:hypothetical protein